ncbi:MAG: SEL1-like repeat protein [Alphaproteobacteria bacterium]|nr:SEL1-like repeat protein [Alphaproteobacteria bacterium]
MYEADDKEIQECYEAYKKNPQKSLKKFQSLEKHADESDLNNPLAQYYLGLLYEEGIGVEKNLNTSIKYFYNAAWSKDKDAVDKLIKFADQNHEDNPLAQYYLGVLYEEGKGVGKDEDTAIKYFYFAAWSKDKDAYKKLQKFADKPLYNPIAQYYLGKLYQEGKGVEKNLKTAIEYFYDAAWNKDEDARDRLKELADQGKESQASFCLGNIYYKGKGVTKNLDKAAEYELKAAREDEKYRTDLFARAKKYPDYDKILKNKECEYLNNKEGILNNSLGRIVLFRGIHYVTNLFNENSINTHKDLNDIDVFLVSSAACSLTGKKFLAEIPGEAELTAGKLICKILKKFKTESEILYNKFHETYTNDHEQFHDCLETPTKGKDDLTQKAFQQYRWVFQNFAEKSYLNTWEEAVKRNPFVSFSCNAEHGLKYAMGQKSFTGGADAKLSAEYSNKGVPKNKYLGKLYTAILSPADIWKLSPTFVVDKHAKNKVEISTHPTNNILTENEVSFSGYVPKGLIKSSNVLIMDNLSTEEQKNYKEINNNFNNVKGKANQIIGVKSSIYEEAANASITGNEYFRIYFDIFENFYAPALENTDFLRTAKWLHAINSKSSHIASSPIQGDGAATKNSIQLLATNLTRRPFNLEQNWTICLKKISMSLCDLGGSGASFAQILRNPLVPLETLSLANCKLAEDDSTRIANGLEENKYLSNLNLDNNEVKNSGAIIFAKILKKNAALQILSLYKTEITDIICFAALFPTGGEAKSLNKTLIELKLDFHLNGPHLKIIQKGLNRNLK